MSARASGSGGPAGTGASAGAPVTRGRVTASAIRRSAGPASSDRGRGGGASRRRRGRLLGGGSAHEGRPADRDPEDDQRAAPREGGDRAAIAREALVEPAGESR